MQNTLNWESHLLHRAHEALEAITVPAVTSADADLLEHAYQVCAGITRQHSRTFFLASSLLPREKRRAVRALYAFCRVSDDIVDHLHDSHPAETLSAWQARTLSSHPSSQDPVVLAWADARTRFNIPACYAEQFLEGVAADLGRVRYATFDELAVYAYGVASTVGLMAMHIVGFANREAIPYAIRLGIALQLTNILRDVGEDWHNGRLYLPKDELKRFGLAEEDIAAGRVTPAWRRFMRFQISRVHRLYAESRPGITLLESDGRFAIAASANLYEAILDDIERHDYDVFHRRAHLSAWGKLRRLPGIWFKAREMEDATIWFDE